MSRRGRRHEVRQATWVTVTKRHERRGSWVVVVTSIGGIGLSVAEAREGYVAQIERLSSIERETSISINRRVDLAKASLFIAAEDDSLVSHSSVPLPVDAFLHRLDDLSMEFCTRSGPALRSSPEALLQSLETFFIVSSRVEPRALYLHSVLTHRSGSAPMLTLIYSEILKMLRLWGLLTFDCELFFPHDSHTLPRGYHKQKSKDSDHHHILTSQTLLDKVLPLFSRSLSNITSPFLLLLIITLTSSSITFFNPLLDVRSNIISLQLSHPNLVYGCVSFISALLFHCIKLPVQVLTDLKEAFWPFPHDQTKSLFLRAANAANYIDISYTAEESGFQIASAKAAHHRLDRGVWTSVRFGDMRRALSACERLILLDSDPKELRDYSVLLYHCGLYEQSLEYLRMYKDAESSTLGSRTSSRLESLEEEAVTQLMTRLNLIMMEDGWSDPSHARNFLGNNAEPW
ncbi:hypothetical protein Tsubulata_008454 [Turnera subulata]|uniref:Protein SirB1 N-terminal domain-containing protein n=1 Tax=Turnera subulata TaxID=218843 RepID=A0A9Q0GCJ8_9ROSI|nr:hypothetical protein Tsubulata_008454 [Turnera subulata]